VPSASGPRVISRKQVDDNVYNKNEVFVLKRFFRSIDGHDAKKQKSSHKSPEIIVEIPTDNDDEPPRVLRGLLDSGSTGCILLNEFTKGLNKRFGTTEQWMTKGGVFTTKAKCRVPMILPDFTRQTKIEFDCHVDPTQKSNNISLLSL